MSTYVYPFGFMLLISYSIGVSKAFSFFGYDFGYIYLSVSRDN